MPTQSHSIEFLLLGLELQHIDGSQGKLVCLYFYKKKERTPECQHHYEISLTLWRKMLLSGRAGCKGISGHRILPELGSTS